MKRPPRIIWRNIRPRMWLWWHMHHRGGRNLAGDPYRCDCGSTCRAGWNRL